MKKFLLLIFGLTFLVNVNAQILDSLKVRDYLEYAERAKKNQFLVQSEEEWLNLYTKDYTYYKQFPTSPGSYLIRAKNQILTGFTIQMLALIGESAILLTAKDLTQNQINTISASAGALMLIGLGLEISGVVNIGKAGVSLNENGIGIKLKF